MGNVVLDPVTRIEGHLRIETRVEGGRVAEARSQGEMFRGFEALLVGRDPFDGPVITQRICGVCPVSHAVSACRAVEAALGIPVPPNGRLLRSLVLGANFLQSHLLHFYHLSALDYVDVEAVLAYPGRDPVLRDLRRWAEGEVASNRVLPVAPLLPRLPGDYAADPAWSAGALGHYAEALEVRQETHRMAALFGGRMPHPSALVPGGVTAGVDPEAVEDYRARLRRVRRFIENAYLPDAVELARRFPAYGEIGRWGGPFLSFGAFEGPAGAPWLPAGVATGGRHEA
ncbi:MAG: nickel-dependent hydrogenase large subunit, partial [Deferrisomatales bacterium]